MMIDRIGGINPLNNVQNTRRTNEAGKIASSRDSINVSDEAKEAAKLYYLKTIADETPDVRSDLVAAIKEKIKNPDYLSSAVISSAADRMMDSFGL